MRMIDEDKLIEESESGCWDIDLKELRMILEYVPTIDAAPVMHGEWVTTRTIIHDGELYCSLCGQEALAEYGRHTYIKSNYCPNCGAEITRFSEHEAVATWNRRAQPERCEIAEYVEGCDECLFCAQPENKPLTLDELREMDGEPVFIVTKHGANWDIVNVSKEDGGPYPVYFQRYGRGLQENGYGKTWLAYRYKPEEVQG